MSIDPLGRVPVTIVTGFLGSGKTTLLNNLLSGSRLGRVAALVNDFGAIDIDAALISSVAQEVVQLANGCICCTINGDLLAAVKKVLALEQPVDRIVVETTGLADPLPVGLTFLQTDLREKCNLEAVVTVVDAANFALDLFDANAAMAQIVHADIIVLNKADLVDAAHLDNLRSRIAVIKPRARIVSAAYAKVPLSLIVDPASSQASLLNFPIPHQTHHRHLLDDGFSACAFRFDKAISGLALQSWLDSGLPAAVFRAKGILHLDRPDARYVFQFCGGRSSFERYDGPVDDTRIVFIGQNIDESALESRLRSCLVEKCARVAHATS